MFYLIKNRMKYNKDNNKFLNNKFVGYLKLKYLV